MDTFRFSKPVVGNILSTLPFAMIFAAPFLGYLSDKVFVSRKKVLVASSLTYAVGWLIMLLYYDSLPIVALYVIFLFSVRQGQVSHPWDILPRRSYSHLKWQVFP